MSSKTRPVDWSNRRGVVIILTAIMLSFLMGFVAFAIDLGVLCLARAEAQNAADSAALAGAWELLDRGELQNSPNMFSEIDAARTEAVNYAALNAVRYTSPVVDLNSSNNTDGDIVVGYLSDPTDLGESLSFFDVDEFNTVQVRVQRTAVRNGQVPLFFAAIWGINSADVIAEATATFKDGVVGYRVTEYTGNAELLPLALHVDSWNALLSGANSTGDNYSYDPDTGAVSAGSDGILELNLFPGAGPTQLPPGNFGTVDIGSSNNSTADLSRQIVSGVNAADLAYHGGSLTLGESGFNLNGDTGLSAGIKDELASIIGIPRAIPLFDSVSGNGNNSMFHIVGFAGIQITSVRLTGPMNQKEVVIQPAHVVDNAVITDSGSGPSYFIYQPVQLVR